MSDDSQNTSRGIVFYSDGSSRNGNPGKLGWAVHGYLYNNKVPKQGSGNTTHILTASGYIPKTEVLNESAFAQIEPVLYVDAFSSYAGVDSNNYAEVKAVTLAIDIAKEFDDNPEYKGTIKKMTVYTDSEYTRKVIDEWSPIWIKNNWIKRDGTAVTNMVLIKALLADIESLKQRGIELEVHWIKGHDGIFGNERVDKLATMGAIYSINGVIRVEKHVWPAKGYWKADVDKPVLISHKRIIFSTLPEYHTPGVYFLTDSVRDENSMGDRTSDGSYAVLKLNEPCKPIEQLREWHSNVCEGINSLVLGRLDKLFSPDVYDFLSLYGPTCLMRESLHSFNCNFVDKKPITKELSPPKLALRAQEHLGVLKGFLDNIDNLDIIKCQKFDMTEKLFDVVDKKGKKSYKLKSNFGVGVSCITVPYTHVTDKSSHNVEININFGLDIIGRNSLKKLEDLNPEVSLIVYKESDKAIMYFTYIKCDIGQAVYAGVFTNTIFF